MWDMVAPKSTVTAREILKQLIMADDRFQKEANIDDARILANTITRESKGFVSPNFLLDVWQETQKP